MPVHGSELIIESGPGRAGPLVWQTAKLRYRPASSQRPGWAVSLSDVRLGKDSDQEVRLSRLSINCPLPSSSDPSRENPFNVSTAPECQAGDFRWETPAGQAGRAEIDLVHDSERVRIDLESDAISLSGEWSLRDKELDHLVLELAEFDVSHLLPVLERWIELDLLYGQITAHLTLDAAGLEGEWQVKGGGFDGWEGQIAGDGLGLSGSIAGRVTGDQQAIDLTVTQRAGELLVGPLYLPAPNVPIEINLQVERDSLDAIHIEHFSYLHPEIVRLRAEAGLQRRDDRWQLDEAELFELEADLEHAWPRWVDGLAASAGFAGLGAKGRLSASARLVDGELDNLDVELAAFELTDPRGRFEVKPTLAHIHQGESGIQLDLDLDGLMIYGLPFGATRVRGAQTDRGWVLQEPLNLPLLDGAVVVDRFTFDPDEEARGVTLDARIEPLSLERLTQTLGWPEFGGELSGDFPGLEFRDKLLDVTGGININAFSGQIRLSELVIERPLGSLPALAAQVEIDRLDLLQLTGAFNFGRMEGDVSGWMRDLRLLDWRPVAMDSRIFTHDDVQRRRISQRAVDNLSNLGGGLGGALIGNTVLSVFEDFPYRRAGLACRLSNNICYINGVAEHESGGFYIVQGRGLPHLDIIGHRRLVDWPQLLEQLASATR